MAGDDVSIRIRLQAAQAIRDARGVSTSLRGIGTAGQAAGRTAGDGLGYLAGKAKYAGFALGGVGLAGAKMGLAFNAQIQSAQVRFSLFTDTAEQARQVMEGVSAVDMKSGFDLGTLSDTAAYLGNAGIAAERLPRYLEGVANAAAAAGGGADKLSRIGVALGQIQSRGTITAEEINQLADAGVNVRQVLRKEFALSGEELANIGEQGISSRKALDAITEHFTSGKMARAAEAQSRTLGGQWDMLTGNVQKLSGAMTHNLAGSLTQDVLPAANKVAEAITKIFERDELTLEQKTSQAMALIRRDLGPFGEQFADQLADSFEKAIPGMMNAAGKAAPKAAGAFVTGWLEAGAWGKLVTGGFLLGKMGAFRPLGGLMGRQFATAFGLSAGTAIPGALGNQKSLMRPGLLAFGGWIGAAIGAGITIDYLMDQNPASRGIGREETAGGRATPRSAFTPEMRRDINERFPGAFPLTASKGVRGNRTPMPNEQRQTGPGGTTARASKVTQRIAVEVDGREVGHATRRDEARRRARN